ncbi:MAG TPA: phosphopantetheine-binding protein [Acidobacteriota bacterium]|jgi:acyl carrier protein|nr:phosphopantetheine-binding protein [Acidobacteriota bacterium]
MTDQEVQDRVLAVFRKNRRVGEASLDLETTFDQLRLDSLEVFSIVFDLEDEFKIAIPDNAAQNMRCIRDVVEAINDVLHSPPEESTAAPQRVQ